MYTELIARLRQDTFTMGEISKILPQAADAIENLNAEVNNFKNSQQKQLEKFAEVLSLVYECWNCPIAKTCDQYRSAEVETCYDAWFQWLKDNRK